MFPLMHIHLPGLQYLHEMEIAHRDIKCENVLITSNYNVKLTDFGFARYMIDSHGKRVLSDTYCGSLSYAAPEILRGYPYNPKLSDIWALGVILYIMLNKSMPFDEENLKRLYELQISRKWKFRSKVIDSLTDRVKKLVDNLLEPDVSKRPHTNQIVQSEWIAMDPRLLILSPAEQIALNNAMEERKRFEEKFMKKETVRAEIVPIVQSLLLDILYKSKCLLVSFPSYIVMMMRRILLIIHLVYTRIRLRDYLE